MAEPFAAARGEDASPAIGDYGLIGDCRTAALVSRDGAIDWLCLPHFSGPSVFAALLDPERGGRFGIRPIGAFRTERRYVGSTAVIETTFTTATGIARLIDLMPVTADRGALRPMREVLRIVEGVAGAVAFEIACEPRPDYARTPARVRSRGAAGHAFTWGDELLLLRSEAALDIASDGGSVRGAFRIAAGETVRTSLAYAKGDVGVVAPLGEAADDRLRETLAWWEGWAEGCAADLSHRDMVVRSAITLKLMTFALSGAVVAAPTSSLPEALGGDRNWDYRYCWLRDAALTMKAFTGLGFLEEAGSFLHWLLHATRQTWPELKIMYDIYGRIDIEETSLNHLAGYRGSRPVRIGNGAVSQLQLDVYGGVISAAVHYVEAGGRLQADEARLLAGLGDTVCKQWREPDHGIWEMRDRKRHYTFSKIMCAVALDGLLNLHDKGVLQVDQDRLRRERASIGAEIEARGYNTAVGSYVGELDGDTLDAALLLIGCMGYRSARDDRVRATCARIEERLGRDGFLYRYEKGGEGLPREGVFGICGFWAIDNLAMQGRLEEAGQSFERHLAVANDLGLYAEEFDGATGAALGNFPQAFTHVGLINAALSLAAAGRDRS